MTATNSKPTTARSVIAAMTAYTLELREAEIKLNQNESPNDFPRDLKDQVLSRLAERPWNIYPDFESSTLRSALARAHGLDIDNIHVGNGSNELLAATMATFVGPGTPVILPKPTFALYEKLIVIAGGSVVPVAIDPATGLLPLDAMLDALALHRGAVVVVCSPNNPTGGVLPTCGIEALLDNEATILYDRAYGDFAGAGGELPSLHDRLVTFSTFSKAWGLAGLRIGWLASTAAICREIRKVKLPYSLNIVSETIAAAALENPSIRDQNVALATAERVRMFETMHSIANVTPFPSEANFIAFSVPGAKEVFNQLCGRGVLVRDISSAIPSALRVSVGSREQNDRFLTALREVT